MRYQDNFGELLALALAIHRRDDVAAGQFIKKISHAVVNDHEEAELLESRSSTKDRQAERLQERLSERIDGLKGLVDQPGLEWLRSQLPH